MQIRELLSPVQITTDHEFGWRMFTDLGRIFEIRRRNRVETQPVELTSEIRQSLFIRVCNDEAHSKPNRCRIDGTRTVLLSLVKCNAVLTADQAILIPLPRPRPT